MWTFRTFDYPRQPSCKALSTSWSANCGSAPPEDKAKGGGKGKGRGRGKGKGKGGGNASITRFAAQFEWTALSAVENFVQRVVGGSQRRRVTNNLVLGKSRGGKSKGKGGGKSGGKGGGKSGGKSAGKSGGKGGGKTNVEVAKEAIDALRSKGFWSFDSA